MKKAALIVFLILIQSFAKADPPPSRSKLNPFAGYGYNAIVLDAKEKPIFEGTDGDPVSSISTESYRHVVGEASEVATTGKGLKRYRRHLISFRPNLTLMIDDIAAYTPTEWEWVLHCNKEARVDEQGQRAVLQEGPTPLEVVFTSPKHALIDTGVERDADAEETKNLRLSVSPLDSEAGQRFIAWIRPLGDNPKPIRVTSFGGSDWTGSKSVGDRVLIGGVRVGNDSIVPYTVDRISGDGHSIAGSFLPGKTGLDSVISLFLEEGRALNLDNRLTIHSDMPITVEVNYSPRKATLTSSLDRNGAIWVRTPKKPTTVRNAAGKTIKWRYDPMAFLTALYLPAGPVKAVISW